MPWHKILSYLVDLAALAAALLWLYASHIPIPTALRVVDIRVDGSGTVAGIAEMSAALQSQGTWNAHAAFATAIAVFLSALIRRAGAHRSCASPTIAPRELLIFFTMAPERSCRSRSSKVRIIGAES
jgi:hypothetical protein